MWPIRFSLGGGTRRSSDRVKRGEPRRSRTQRRVVVVAPAKIRLSRDVNRPYATALLDNLSLGGAGMRSSLTLDLGETIDLLVDLMNGQKLRLSGRIIRATARVKGFQTIYGVRFFQVQGAQAEALTNYISAEEQRMASGVRLLSGKLAR